MAHDNEQLNNNSKGEHRKDRPGQEKTEGKPGSYNDTRSNQTDEGQGAAGLQGQYAGNDAQDLTPENRTAPDRKDPDTMNQNGSSQLAMGSRDTEGDQYSKEEASEQDEYTKDEVVSQKKDPHIQTGIQKNMNETNDSQ